METDMSQFYEAFFFDARERLSETEHMLISIKIPHIENEMMNAIFRAIHSIKGSTATFGFKQTTLLAHELENILDSLRHPECTECNLTTDHIDTLLAANDELIQQLDDYQTGHEPDENRTNGVIKRLQHGFNSLIETRKNEHSINDPSTSNNQPEKTVYQYKIELVQNNEQDMASLAESLSLLGQVTKRNSIDGKVIIELSSTEKISTIKSICSFTVDLKNLKIAINTTQYIESTLNNQNVSISPRTVLNNTYIAPGQISQTLPTSIRVHSQKLYLLNKLVNELSHNNQKLADTLEQSNTKVTMALEKLMSRQSSSIRELSQIVSSIQLISLDLIFSRFPRMVRELALQLNKKARLNTNSSSLELDPFLIERLIDPITHLIRNCLDHGIESPEKRLLCGKHEVGEIKLSAKCEKEMIYIEISDDGIGLNRERIIEKAREKGITLTTNLSDQQAWELIFEPGVTTAMSVTEVSGRGVGMDIVKRNVSELGGKIQIQSIQDQGTIFTIVIPMANQNNNLSPEARPTTHA